MVIANALQLEVVRHRVVLGCFRPILYWACALTCFFTQSDQNSDIVTIQLPRWLSGAIIWRSDDVFTLWPWPLTIWPWMFVPHRVSRVETVYKIWAKSNNPRLSFRPTFKGGTSEWLSGVRGVRDWTVPNLGRGHYRCSPNLFYISDICILRHNAGGSKASVENWGQIPHFLPHTVEMMEGWPRWWTAEMSDWKNIDLVQRKV